MARIVPFKGIYYNREKVSGDEVVAPPYDVITPEMKEELYRRSSYNVVRIDFGKDFEGDTDSENRYTRAARYLREWLAGGVLLRSGRAAFYAYRMDYEFRGKKESLTGFFGALRLAELGNGVYPHEDTHSKPKYDRLALLEKARANTSPIFSLYSSPERRASEALSEATREAPYLQARDSDGATHSFWIVEDEALIEAIGEDLMDKEVFIADGHHRYETALDFQKTMRRRTPNAGADEPYDYVLMFLANTHDNGLTILPTHRLVNIEDPDNLLEKLKKHFDVEELPSGTDMTRTIEGRVHNFGLCLKGALYRLRYRGGGLEGLNPAIRELDVVVLHEMVFDKLLGASSWGYEMDAEKAVRLVEAGRYEAAFFLNPTAVADVERVALGGARMPPKSTYFYPKVRTGFVMNSLESF